MGSGSKGKRGIPWMQVEPPREVEGEKDEEEMHAQEVSITRRGAWIARKREERQGGLMQLDEEHHAMDQRSRPMGVGPRASTLLDHSSPRTRPNVSTQPTTLGHSASVS